jgi:hypothetical protein
MARSIYVAERDTGLIHVEEKLVRGIGRRRISVTRCGKHLDVDTGEAVGRIFSLGLSHLGQDPCEECLAVGRAEARELAGAVR